MENLLLAVVVLLPLAYLSTATAYGLAFWERSEGAERLAPRLLLGCLVVHAGYLATLAQRYHQLPAATLSQLLSLMAFAVALLYALLEQRTGSRGTGVWVVGLALAFQVLASVFSGTPPEDRELFHQPLFALHVSLSLVGYVGLALAAVYGFLFLGLYRELKGDRFGRFFGRLPPLAELEKMMLGALTIGFLALTAGVAVGLVWAFSLYGLAWLRDLNILASLALWVLYGAALMLRRLQRWQGRQTAVASLTGLALMLVSLVLFNLLFSRFHEFR
ncbi:MAG: cytochrome c biogenesis protein CcsA [Thermoanaerobaculia bacterium]